MIDYCISIGLPEIIEPRGRLSFGEFDKHIPFDVKRYFIIYDVPISLVRGGHAHKLCSQFILCLRGSCTLLVKDGFHEREFFLNSPTHGVLVPPMIWGEQYNFSSDALLIVFASEYYEKADYINDFSEFIKTAEAMS
jgi:UDP-2-acetamido-3-amino-2,3-dideoxy-glucuronate N-acetyltransferase